MLFLAVLLLGLIAGPVAWVMARRRGGAAMRAALAAGGGPVLIGVMWWVYNGITDRLGLDRVVNLLVNLVLFVGLGIAIGVGWAYLPVRHPEEPAPDSGKGTEKPK